jgi:putative endonuclease
MGEAHELGRRGEALAARILRARGWTIVDRNYRAGHREIDLVARRGPIVAFIEVKTRTDCAFGHPLAAITRRKRLEIARVARRWLRAYGRPGDTYRFDAIAVTWPAHGMPSIEHTPDAWRLD